MATLQIIIKGLSMKKQKKSANEGKGALQLYLFFFFLSHYIYLKKEKVVQQIQKRNI